MALIGKTPADVRDYQIEGPGGLLKNAPLWCVDAPRGPWPKYEPSKRRITWPNDSWATVFSSEEPDAVRGFSGDTAWLDELMKYRNPRLIWNNLKLGMREVSHDRPRTLISSTPRPDPLLEEIEADPHTVTVIGYSFENASNLAPEWLQELEKFRGTRIWDQEVMAGILELKEGLVYPSFGRLLYPAGNVDEGVRDPGGDVPILVGMDFNVDPMSAVVGVRQRDEFWCLHSLEIGSSNTEETALEIKRMFPGRKLIVCPDPAGNSRSTKGAIGETDFTILRRLGFTVRAPVQAPAVEDRVNNTEAMLLQRFIGEDGHTVVRTRRRVRIHPRCTALIRGLKGLKYKPLAVLGPDGRTVYTAVPDKNGLDHICDALGYLLWQEFNVMVAPPAVAVVQSPFG